MGASEEGSIMRVSAKSWASLAATVSALALAGCATANRSGNVLPAASFVGEGEDGVATESYIIGPLDELTIFVWRNNELGANVQVRPDGRISTPLLSEMVAAGKTPAQLADDIRQALVSYIQEPLVSVMVNRPHGTFSQQVRIVGATDLRIASLLRRGDVRANVRLEPGDVIIIPESMF